MLIEQTHFPQRQGGNIPWGTIILAVVIIGGVGYMTYQVMKDPVIIPNPKSKENERG